MSMTKREMETDAEKALKLEKEQCSCSYNWDDKFEELCPKHRAEQQMVEHHEYAMDRMLALFN